MKKILALLILLSTVSYSQDYGTLIFEDNFDDNSNGRSRLVVIQMIREVIHTTQIYPKNEQLQ